MKTKKIVVFTAIIIINLLIPRETYKLKMDDNEAEGYLQYHHQVNFDDLDVFVINGSVLEIAFDSTNSSIDSETIKDIEALKTSLSECREIEKEIVALLNKNQQLTAISFTEVPLEFAEARDEWVLAAETAEDTASATSSSSKRKKFTMYTSVTREYSADVDGKYKYITKTMGSWSKNSFLGGSNYPASGTDYVLQTTPNTWKRTSHSMTANYDNSPTTGTAGEEFWAVEEGTNYLTYAILDDPYDFAKARQNTSFILTCESVAADEASPRLINSYYVHTWSETSIYTSFTENSSKGVSINIIPSSNQCWVLYNHITFDF